MPKNTSRTASPLAKNDLTSPRIQHFDGDVPPALSPLDAIAARSRRLAKELEDTRRAGENRLSRLPPQIVTESLTEHQNTRPPIFRALSDGVDTVPPLPVLDRDRAGSLPRLANPLVRPASQHARVSAVGKLDGHVGGPESARGLARLDDNWGADPVASPSRLDAQAPWSPTPDVASPASSTRTATSRQASAHSQPDLVLNLSPPPKHRLRPYHEASDDDYTSSNAGSTFSRSRKLSSSSGMSAPHSPVSPYADPHGRTASNISLGSPTRNASARNFSRPMSSSSMVNLGTDKGPFRGPLALQMSHLRSSSSLDEAASPPGFMSGEAASYTHMTYSLPRGRRVSDRRSGTFFGLSAPHFKWHEPMFPGSPPMEPRDSSDLPAPSPRGSARPSREDQRQPPSARSSDGESAQAPVPVKSPDPSATTTTGTGGSASADARSSEEEASWPQLLPPPLSPVEEMSLSSRSNSTVRPGTIRTVSTYQGLSADDHVTKAIDLHEQGQLKESTYHLRIAANKGHATGMLLYALACRHGWGMRPNQKEGVQWLRKAVDSAMLELADDEQSSGNRPAADFHEKKTHRAQFALSIYELGVSHLNGWGIEQDKALALRCFEIAGSWGDADALTEAGFCYAEGIGCKKDMKKAAKFYRMAEAKGVSMVGNSWIHKDKYNDSDDDAGGRSRTSRKNSAAKPRSKSKSRSLFGRRKAEKT